MAERDDETTTPAELIGLNTLRPAPGSRKPRKRVGRGEGSGTGKTAGRGQKGAGSRSGAKRKVNFEGGQMPLHMRMRKLRGPTKKMSMPFEPFRTHTQPVNLKDLEERFDAGAEVTLDALRTIDPTNATKEPVPYTGIQYVQIPEFQDLGTRVSQQFAAVLAGNQSVEEALETAQSEAEAVAEDGYKD